MVGEGYAVVEPDIGIDIRSISTSPRGAKVNWLMTRAGVIVTNDWSDQMIDDTFERVGAKADAECRRVSVTVLNDS